MNVCKREKLTQWTYVSEEGSAFNLGPPPDAKALHTNRIQPLSSAYLRTSVQDRNNEGERACNLRLVHQYVDAIFGPIVYI